MHERFHRGAMKEACMTDGLGEKKRKFMNFYRDNDVKVSIGHIFSILLWRYIVQNTKSIVSLCRRFTSLGRNGTKSILPEFFIHSPFKNSVHITDNTHEILLRAVLLCMDSAASNVCRLKKELYPSEFSVRQGRAGWFHDDPLKKFLAVSYREA
jgi:hypothetical protein